MNDINLYEVIPEEQFPLRIFLRKMGEFKYFLHWHEHTEILFVFSGTARLRCGDKLLTLKENDCAIVNENELHECVDGICEYGSIIIPPWFIEDGHIIFKNLVHDSRITELAVKIFEEYKNTSSSSRHAIKGYTHLLISHLIKNYSEATLSESSYKRYTQKLNNVNRAIKHISTDFTEKITTKSLAQMLHLSEGHFCHIFKEITGKTAKEYINQLRISKAKSLLKSTEMTITEIAFYCGFCDANYFSRTFRKYTGTTAQQYRNERE